MQLQTRLTTVLILSTAAGTLFVTVPKVSAHVGSEIFPIYELATADLPSLEDESLDDWEEVLPDASIVMSNFMNTLRDPNDVADLAIRVFLAWHLDSQRLYMGVQTADDVVLNSYDGLDPYLSVRYDSFQIFVDGDHSGGAYERYSRDVTALSGWQAQRYGIVANAPPGDILELIGLQPGVSTQTEYARVHAWERASTPVITGIELYLTPWDALDNQDLSKSVPSKLRPDTIVGYNMIFFDHDESTNTESIYSLIGTYEVRGAGPFDSADGFADGLLIPCAHADCSGTRPETAVGRSSWARVKASLVP